MVLILNSIKLLANREPNITIYLTVISNSLNYLCVFPLYISTIETLVGWRKVPQLGLLSLPGNSACRQSVTRSLAWLRRVQLLCVSLIYRSASVIVGHVCRSGHCYRFDLSISKVKMSQIAHLVQQIQGR